MQIFRYSPIKYRVRVKNELGTSDFTNELTCTIPPPPPPPPPSNSSVPAPIPTIATTNSSVLNQCNFNSGYVYCYANVLDNFTLVDPSVKDVFTWNVTWRASLTSGKKKKSK